jgi:hypothetical protein
MQRESAPRGYRSGDRALLAEAWASPYLFPLARSWGVRASTTETEESLRDPASARAILLDGGAALALYRKFDWVEQRCMLSIMPADESATPDRLTCWLRQATDLAWYEWNIARLYGEIIGEQTAARAVMEGTPWQVEATIPRSLSSWPGGDATDLLYVGCLREDVSRSVATERVDQYPRRGSSRSDSDWSFQPLDRCIAGQVASWFRDPAFFFTTSRPDLLPEAAVMRTLLGRPSGRCYVALSGETPVALGCVDWTPERRIVHIDFRCMPDRERPPDSEPPDARALLGSFLRLIRRLYLPRALVRESVPIDHTVNALFAGHGFAPCGVRRGHLYRNGRRHDVLVSACTADGSGES